MFMINHKTKTKVNLGIRLLKMSKNMNDRATKFLTVSSVSSDSIVKGIIDDIVNTAVSLPKSTSKKPNIYNIILINMTQSCQIKQRYTFHLHPAFIE
jgi:5-keto 4-deoxyuronate isomerase